MMMWPWPDGDPFFRTQTPPQTLDARLTRSVAERLRAHPVARRAAVTVEVQNGVALLSGSVGAGDEIRRAVVATAHGTPGVRDVCDMLSAGRPAVEPADPPDGAGEPVADAAASPAGRLVGIAAAVWLAAVLTVALGWAGLMIGGLIAVVLLEAFRRAGPSRP